MATKDQPEVTEDLLQGMVRRIVDEFHPDRIVLFGSYAWGTPRPDSDVDLLVVMDSDLRPARRSAAVSMACRPRRLATDFIVKTPAELQERLAMGDTFMVSVLREGKTLYARAVAVSPVSHPLSPTPLLPPHLPLPAFSLLPRYATSASS